MSPSCPRFLVIAACLLGGCGHGEGLFEAPISSDQIRPLRVLDLTTGTVHSAPEGFAPTATRLIFRRIPTGTRNLPASDVLRETGPVAVATTPYSLDHDVWLCQYELSQAQWNLLAGVLLENPWNNIVPNAAGGGSGAISAALPAWGLDGTTCINVLATWSTAHPSAEMRLPSAAEWESAARSPQGAGAYGWGDNPAAVGNYALVHETGNSNGPRAIMAGSPLGGFYNLHGNVWEWVRDDSGYHLRGGSWCDGVRSAQSGNKRACSPDAQYALAGLRPVLVLP